MAFRCVRVLHVCLLVPVLVLAGLLFGGGHALGTPALLSLPVGRSFHVIWPGEVLRTFHLYRPPGLSGAVPLVVMLHGGYGDGRQAEQDYHWEPQADSGHFLVAFPDGLARAWNAGSCCGLPGAVNVDDVGFITRMVAAIEQTIPIDPARVYVTGMSNGAMMTLRLGCETDIFAAIAPVAGTQLVGCSHVRPTSVLQIHGTADDRVPYDGGPGRARKLDGAPNVDGPSVPAVNAAWRSIDSCAPPASTTDGVVTTQTAMCPDGRNVELISIAGAGHQWPGSAPNPLLTRLGLLPEPSTALDATSTIWQFFGQHHR